VVNNLVKLAAIVAVFLAAFGGFQAYSVMSRPRTPQEIQAQLERDVANLKGTLPQKVHPMVTWFDVEAGDQTIIYKYQIHASYSAISSKQKQLEEEMAHSPLVWAAMLMLPSDVKAQAKLYDDNKNYVFTIDLK
jgi:hypothetical protein